MQNLHLCLAFNEVNDWTLSYLVDARRISFQSTFWNILFLFSPFTKEKSTNKTQNLNFAPASIISKISIIVINVVACVLDIFIFHAKTSLAAAIFVISMPTFGLGLIITIGPAKLFFASITIIVKAQRFAPFIFTCVILARVTTGWTFLCKLEYFFQK